jgi:hypothetical protein
LISSSKPVPEYHGRRGYSHLAFENGVECSTDLIGAFMKLVAAILLGIFVAFALTAAGEEAVVSLRDKGARLPYFEAAVLFPLIALIVGSLIGLVARNRALLAALLVFAPCVVYVLLETGRGCRALSWWVILITLGSMYFGLGVGAAIFVSGRMNRSVGPTS